MYYYNFILIFKHCLINIMFTSVFNFNFLNVMFFYSRRRRCAGLSNKVFICSDIPASAIMPIIALT